MFNDYDSRYYEIIGRLNEMAPFEMKDAIEVFQKVGFLETPLALSEAVFKDKPDAAYPFFEKMDSGQYRSMLQNPCKRPLSIDELKWLKAVLGSDKAKCLLDAPLLEKLQDLLNGISPLYQYEQLVGHHVASDKDDFTQQHYQSTLNLALQAIEERRIVYIEYAGVHGSKLATHFFLHELEYSPRDGKIRLICSKVRPSGLKKIQRLNLSRVSKLFLTSNVYTGDFEYKTQKNSLNGRQILELEILNERNGIERCFCQFSVYERLSFYRHEKGTCHMTMHYLPSYEAELMIQVLSFGPIVSVLGPDDFKKRFIERLFSNPDATSVEMP